MNEAAEQVSLALAQTGDIEAFDRLMVKYRPLVVRLARAFARADADADDIIQETMVRAMRSIPQFRVESSLSTWLTSLTRHAAIDWYRKKHHRETPEDIDERPVTLVNNEIPLEPERAAVSRDSVDLLYEAIRELPPQYRHLLVLFEMEGLSYEELAEMEDIPIGTVRSRLSRGRKQLADLMQCVQRLEDSRVNGEDDLTGEETEE